MKKMTKTLLPPKAKKTKAKKRPAVSLRKLRATENKALDHLKRMALMLWRGQTGIAGIYKAASDYGMAVEAVRRA